ncbi:MAG TPA: hypothetical protein VMB35_08580 [Methanomicrobiales archaeon]|nr:hypothetical protein [Methanomicrobiales archaeon]
MNPLIAGIGLFFVTEGIANLIYWRADRHPWYFQAGRVTRVVLGMVLVVVST